MTYLVGILLAIALISGQAIAASPPVDDNEKQRIMEYCKTHECRGSIYIKLKKEDGTYYEYASEVAPPVIQSESILVFPGETILVEADIEDNRLVNLKTVKTMQHPAKTITLTFWQDPTLRDGTDMILKVVNPFDKYLRYKLGMTLLTSSTVRYTSSCPVLPGKISFELWPHPIFQLVLTQFQFVEGEEARICK